MLGVNLAGYLRSEKGVGESVRSSIRSLQAAGIPYVLNDFEDPTSANSGYDDLAPEGWNPHPINLIHVNPKEVDHFVRRLGPEYLRERYNIGYWAWELPRFPTRWLHVFDYFDEIWAPSRFTADAIAAVAPIPVVRIPHTIEAPATIGQPREAADFLFAFAFDFRSVMERKNPLGLVMAFRRAFGPEEPVSLLIKTMHADFDPAGAAALARAAERANIRILDAVLERSRATALLQRCDCYVSLHRAEGFGLSLAEAMALGKPVIATAYSGNLDFMTSGNSYLVDCEQVAIADDHGEYDAGETWAEPDLDHAAELMRLVYENRAAAAAVGDRARREIASSLSPDAVGDRVRERLQRVWPLTTTKRRSRPRALVRPAQLPPDPDRWSCSIIIPVHGNAALTRGCLEGIFSTAASEHSKVEVIVVDDASTDSTAALLGEYRGRIRVVSHAENLGFARSCNDGAEIATGEMLVFLNNDTVPQPGWLRALIQHAAAHPDAGIVGSKLLFPDGSVQHAGVVICEDRRPRHIYAGFPEGHPAVCRSRAFQIVTAACMLIRRDLFAGLRGFDTSYRNGFEDVDLCLRAGELGSAVHYCAESVLYHYQSMTRNGRTEEELRNFELYCERWIHRVEPDEVRHYVEDGLLRVAYAPTYPVRFHIAPELGTWLREQSRELPTDRWWPAPAVSLGNDAPPVLGSLGSGSAVRPRPAPPLPAGDGRRNAPRFGTFTEN